MSSKTTWITLIIVIFLAGAAGSYFFFQHFEISERQPATHLLPPAPGFEEQMTLRIYSPKGSRLEMTERALPKRNRDSAIAEAVLEEYFRMPQGEDPSPVPQNVRVIGLYRGEEGILYIDLSDELRRNFQGDALAEYLLLRGIFESLMANVQGFQDAKILIEGKELETLGGHVSLKYPLGSIVGARPKAESGGTGDES